MADGLSLPSAPTVTLIVMVAQDFPWSLTRWASNAIPSASHAWRNDTIGLPSISARRCAVLLAGMSPEGVPGPESELTFVSNVSSAASRHPKLPGVGKLSPIGESIRAIPQKVYALIFVGRSWTRRP